MTLRDVSGSLSYGINEDENYKRYLCRRRHGVPEPLNLYRVSFLITNQNSWTDPVFVLAESPSGAAQQATTHERLQFIEKLHPAQYNTLVQHVPFLIRGWGDTEF